ncbi:5-deoxy-glucuronate isomerase [Aneurinibacillus sp. Ricciae_BoGa-3]|uniref:5-deoxy-glucuronate isomerase n=1 Tax=Aneurinibacillus sp. Ricciae_BoGa-3 TaxID=3022697 RepID=UPI002341C06A|nr:5-deoxy-glucuronate isomerase [Aneurinibacillus sp. Ricciae_BoGa-3]WCK53199.1 5-deoxy-glucuronate isomerase [Aneurinibacillus sp. Ricciae_BoGa-3]
MKRYFKAKEVNGYQEIFQEEGPLLKYLAFGKVSLNQGQVYTGESEGFEIALVLIKGTATVSSDGNTWQGLGGRSSVFDGKATTVYVPCQSEYVIQAETDVEVAVCKVKAEQKLSPFVVRPEEVLVHQRGKADWKREVHDIIADNANGRVQRMILGETFNHPGNWSSYPPHKHDGEHYPEEPNFEEIYYYQANPEQGFGVQLHYTKDGSIDDAYMVRHGDSFAIDKGYHPVSAAGGYQVYYLWFMAGEIGRNLKPYDDPDHKWLHSAN